MEANQSLCMQYTGLHTAFFFWGGGGGGGRGDDCHAYNIILVNKSHNAAITNDFFLLVYVINVILFVLYVLHVDYYGILGGGGGSQCTPTLYATLV